MRIKIIDHTNIYVAPQFRSYITNWCMNLEEAMVEFKSTIPDLDIRYKDDGSAEMWYGDKIWRTYIPEDITLY